jgi:tetratricopeptide (TPR) repeat protein
VTVRGYANPRDENLAARDEFRTAIARDPNYALAHAGLAWALWVDYAENNFLDSRQREEAFELTDRSLALQENWLGHVVRSKRFLAPEAWGIGYKPDDHDAAVAELRKAVALEPNNADALVELADALAFAGDPAEAAELVRKAKRLNPNFPRWYYHRLAGIVSYLNASYEDAVRELSAWHASEEVPVESVFWLAPALAQHGEVSEARAMLADLAARQNQKFYLQYFERLYPFKRDEDRARFIDGLRKAGVPDAND